MPTKKQKALMWQSVGVARWSYNHYLDRRNEEYTKHIADFYAKYGVEYSADIAEELNAKVFSYSSYDCNKEITQLKKLDEYDWLKDVDSQLIKYATEQAYKAFKNFFAGRANFPKHKSRNKPDASFYSNYQLMHKIEIENSIIKEVKSEDCAEKVESEQCDKDVNPDDNKTYKTKQVRLAKLGIMQLAEDIPHCEKYSNPVISHDGVNWWLSFGYEKKIKLPELTDEVIGIDLGIKSLVTCLDGMTKENINKTKRVTQLKKRHKRQQRKVSRMINKAKKTKTKLGGNYKKAKRELQKTQIKLNNIRTNYLHQVTTEIVKKLPKTIVMEDLNVRGMMKNKHLAKAIQEQCFYTFRTMIEYKAKMRGIEVIFAERFYPSSKICSCCGAKKTQLLLSERRYKCTYCGLNIDRDLNAAINLKNLAV